MAVECDLMHVFTECISNFADFAPQLIMEIVHQNDVYERAI